MKKTEKYLLELLDEINIRLTELELNLECSMDEVAPLGDIYQ